MGFNSLKATEPLLEGSLFFPNKFPEILDTHLINLRKIKGWTEIVLLVKANMTWHGRFFQIVSRGTRGNSPSGGSEILLGDFYWVVGVW